MEEICFSKIYTNGKAWLTIRRTKINMYTVFVYLDKGAATYGLGKRGKRRLLNEVFKKNQSLRSNLLLRSFLSSDL